MQEVYFKVRNVGSHFYSRLVLRLNYQNHGEITRADLRVNPAPIEFAILWSERVKVGSKNTEIWLLNHIFVISLIDFFASVPHWVAFS